MRFLTTMRSSRTYFLVISRRRTSHILSASLVTDWVPSMRVLTVPSNTCNRNRSKISEKALWFRGWICTIGKPPYGVKSNFNTANQISPWILQCSIRSLKWTTIYKTYMFHKHSHVPLWAHESVTKASHSWWYTLLLISLQSSLHVVSIFGYR